ncbi:hypothetical protein [Alkalihalobacillus sp. TS-13]|uniref:hypothetical protein n=1 Tax=Alkalihalobacillus sp. TS-13 TaxID=2842455 RepID=UPI001C88562F|nr:hypothetical protein [Alkalihalobacillus sp. TS-13]
MLKRFSTLFLAIAFLFTVPQSTFANSGWQTIGEYDALNQWWDGKGWHTSVYGSGGGYIRFCVSGHSSDNLFTVYDYDPGTSGSGGDDDMGSLNLKSGECATMYVEPWVDGSNGKVEVYIASYVSGNTMTKLQD